MNLITVQFLFDFGSPNAYLSHKVIPQIEARSTAKFEYIPILLGGLFKLSNNRSPAETNAQIPAKRAYDLLELDRFVNKHGLTAYRRNPHFPINTLQIMRGAVAAQSLGCFKPYVDAVFASMWEREKKMDEPEVIAGELTAAGLDASALMAASQSPDVKSRLLANTQDAHARGAFGSPTFFVGEEIFFGKDRLDDVEVEINRVRSR
ncbi:2-hydroxychromene-2-carboxylate isomerase [Variovorax paradoxus]|uniref:2-hydroxychromene-2-carboxylate isomerase n=1 Tax=Variovorax paradoxus TaxID=34073 RepID=A0A5Q0MA17_VARPD|nr:2-hydroxychromene-2-carboxylate isomerase [Variovorax paradoxus]QFZ86243.1 2-hydroxychromene-2-carboxylate isomerase [Variovorax paradoxus]